MIELRKDPVTGRWVIISTERALRPMDLKVNDHVHEEGPCPFCHGNENMAPNEILAFRPDGSKRDEAGWTLRVVPNRFPALRIEGELKKEGEGMYDKMSGVGAHEVIIETPHHEKNLADLPLKRTEDLLWAFKGRLLDLERDVRLKYVMIFKNSGARAGATLEHPHCQLIALPVVPREVNDEMTGSQNYYNFKERCVFCDMIRQEMSAGARLVMRSAMHAAIAPFAARFPFETWVMPIRHESRFEQSDTEEMKSAAEVLHGVLKRISALLGNPPYNFYLHNAPLRTANLPQYHWHIEILPSITTVAGFERGSAFYVNPVPPEDAAEEMRKAGGMA